MSKIFISHSRVDTELTKNVAAALQNIGDTPVIMEYIARAGETVPPYALIRQHVREADYVMLFKTDNAISSEYTRNWIVFEVGLAAAMNKRLFVFERKGPTIQFPIPYVTDYMIFDPAEVADILKLQAIAKEVHSAVSREEIEPSKGMGWLVLFMPELVLMAGILAIIVGMLAGIKGAIHGPININCQHCHSSYHYYAGILEPFQCPVCLSEIDPSVGYDRKAVDLLRELKGFENQN